MPSATVRMKRSRRVHFIKARTLTPATAMVEYKNTCIPPRTDGGIEANTAPNFAITPIKIRKPLAAQPARRDAQPVRTMTPLLPACETIGGPVASALKKLPKPSHNMPPCTRLLNSAPSMSTPESSAVAKMSGMHDTA